MKTPEFVKSIARGFVRNAGKISGVCFGLGNAGWLVKSWPRMPPALEAASSIGCLAMSGFLLLTDRWPRLKVLAGICGLAGSAALGAAGIGLPAQNAQLLAATSTGVFTLGMIFERQVNNFAQMTQASGRRLLKNIFTPLAKYPVATGAALDLTLSTLPMAFAAVARRDKGLMVMSGLWIAGGIAAIAMDDGIKAAAKPQPSAAHIS